MDAILCSAKVSALFSSIPPSRATSSATSLYPWSAFWADTGQHENLARWTPRGNRQVGPGSPLAPHVRPTMSMEISSLRDKSKNWVCDDYTSGAWGVLVAAFFFSCGRAGRRRSWRRWWRRYPNRSPWTRSPPSLSRLTKNMCEVKQTSVYCSRQNQIRYSHL